MYSSVRTTTKFVPLGLVAIKNHQIIYALENNKDKNIIIILDSERSDECIDS